MPDSREPYGRLVRETWVAWAREQPAPKPSWLAGWDDPDLDDGQREVDMRIGAAVAAAERERITAELKACMAGFFGHYGNNSAPSLNLARDLAEGIRQILDKKPIEVQERSDEKGQAS